ncbi:MAG: hypothetical protein ABIG70_03135 [Pseudomonadota bacterium]
MSQTGADQHRAQEHQHALHAIDWMEIAIYAIERSDYQASDHAICVALMHIKTAAGLTHERNDR